MNENVVYHKVIIINNNNNHNHNNIYSNDLGLDQMSAETIDSILLSICDGLSSSSSSSCHKTFLFSLNSFFSLLLCILFCVKSNKT